jgi:Tfp pilus assembly protein PilF
LLRRAITLDAGRPAYHINHGVALQNLEKFDLARQSLSRALQIDRLNIDALINLGVLDELSGKSDDAVKRFSDALRRVSTPLIHTNMGNALVDLGDFRRAISEFNRALDLSPDYAPAHGGLANAYLAIGALSAGWAEYEQRVFDSKLTLRKPPDCLPRWSGKGNAGRLLVCGEQGLGDEIFFASGLSLVEYLSGDVVVQVDRRLVGLLSRSFPALRFIGDDESVDASRFDHYMLMGSIFHALQGRVKEPERRTRGAYLKADMRRVESIRRELSADGKDLIGVTWRSQRAELGHRKSVALRELGAVLSRQDARYVSLQYGDVKQEIDEFRTETGIDIMECPSVDNLNDIDGHAALIKACDYAFLISSTTAHIAGALGKRATLCLKHGRNRFFYWNNRGGDRSFWYPSLSIIPQ